MTQPLPGQLALDLAEDPQPTTPGQAPAGGAPWWLAFSADHDPQDVRRIFRTRTGQDPAELRPGLGGLLLAGPVTTARRTV